MEIKAGYNIGVGNCNIVHLTVVHLVAKPLNSSKAKGDLVMIQTLLLIICKLLCYCAKWILVSVNNVTFSLTLNQRLEYTAIKWPIDHCKICLEVEFSFTYLFDYVEF